MEPRSDDLERALGLLYSSVATGDSQVWDDFLAEDALFVGTDRDEWFDGGAASVVVRQVEAMHAAGVTMTGGDVTSHAIGEVVWGADRPTVHLPDGTSEQARLTVVAVRHDGVLRAMQFHLSVPRVSAAAGPRS